MNDQRDMTVNYELLGKFLSGEASPEEAIEVDDWIQQSAENRLLFDQVSASWKGIPLQSPQVEQSRQAAPESPKAAAVYPLKFRRYWIGIAASLLILCGSLFLLFRPSHHQAVHISASDGHTPDKDNYPQVHISLVTRQAGREIVKDTLPDQSIVVQNVQSAIHYADNFNVASREIQLHGEAWFNVTPNPERPFIIHVGDIRVVVLGTSFNINEDASRIEASVKTGTIMMSNDRDSLVVKGGQKGTYRKSEKTFKWSPTFNANDQGYATKILNFENIPLKEIAAQIEKAYGVTVVFQNDSLKNLTMSSSFDNNPITYIFDVISITLHVKYTIENKTVYIRSS